MIALPPGVRVYLACGPTDMRKGMAGLAMLVQLGGCEFCLGRK
jgi:transposase